jgi:plasmid maintenance system killer protein
VIAGFKDKDVKELFTNRTASKRLAPYADAALRKLVSVDAATTVSDLKSPGNDLKKVAGSKSTWQIRIDGKYRVRFTWDGRDASDVEVGDFH